MAIMVMNLHEKLGALIHRFLAIQSQDPIGYVADIGGLIGERSKQRARGTKLVLKRARGNNAN